MLRPKITYTMIVNYLENWLLTLLKYGIKAKFLVETSPIPKFSLILNRSLFLSLLPNFKVKNRQWGVLRPDR